MERKFEWRLIKREQMFKDRWADICIDTCEKPNGSIVTPFYVYRLPDFATALAITKDGKVILERMYRHGISKTCIELPGGIVDQSDKSLEEAMGRELLEETGYRFDKIEYLGKISQNPTNNNNYMHMFIATGGVFDESVVLDLDEDVEVFLATIEEVIEYLECQKFIQAMQISTLFYALKKLGKIKI